MTPKKTIIVGGGIAGLSCASHLQRLGLSSVVLEAADVAGGNVNTRSLDGYRLELGPNTFMGSATDVLELVTMNGLESKLITTSPKAGNRFIVRNGRIHCAPIGALQFLRTRLLSTASKIYLATEPWRLSRGTPEDSAFQFFVRRFGLEAAEILAGAFISGVYAGDMHKLSAPAAFPLFWRFETQSGSMIRGAFNHKRQQRKAGLMPRRGLFSLEGGLGTLATRLTERLGDSVKLGHPALSIRNRNARWIVSTPGGEFESEHLVLAVPPLVAAALVRTSDSKVSALLEGIEMAPVAVVYLSYKDDGKTIPEGFGFLAPRLQGTRSLGVLFSSSLFEDRAPAGYRLLTAYVGGSSDNDALALSDEELFNVVRDDLAKLALLPPGLAPVSVIRHRHAIPQFNLGYLDRMNCIHERLYHLTGLHLAGNYLTGVGMKDAVGSGKKVAERLAYLLGNRTSPAE